MDPVRNPYAPGAGQRPPELAGRDEQLDAFDVVLERIARGRPERSIVLTGLRGVGKTVLLNALRSSAVRAGLGDGQARGATRPGAAPTALGGPPRRGPRARPPRTPTRWRTSSAWSRPSRSATPRRAPGCADRWNPGIDAPAVTGRADSGDIEIDLVELLTDVGGLAADLGRGIAVFVDEMQDLGPDDVSAVCAACHEISQSGLPVIVVGAGLPHLPAVLSASKSYSERLFRYQRIDRLDRSAADLALVAPAQDEGAEFTPEALEAMYAATAGYPYFVQAYGKVAWDVAPRIADHRAGRRASPSPEAEAELAVGFFGSRYERATPAEREYLRAMADAASTLVDSGEGVDETESVPTAAVAARARPQAPVAVAGAGCPAQEGADLLRRARADRLHRAALRALPAGNRMNCPQT